MAAAMREEDIKHREKLLRFDARQRTMREDDRIRTEKRDREFFDTMQKALATPQQVATFRVKLDRYDEKTVEALMENRAALDEVREKLDRMLGRAHVMPDGRRVFRTTDGEQVFDEYGVELRRDEIDPAAIADHHPKWEEWRAGKDVEATLNREQKELLDYQARIDAARERVDQDGVTAKELDDLGGDLDAAMPEAVRRKLGNDAPSQDAKAAPTDLSGGVRINATPTDQRPVGYAPM